MNALESTTRGRLLAATRQVVADQGLAGATSRTITSLAGENLASITYHFGSKDALVATALIDHVRELIQPVLAQLTADLPLPQKLVQSFETLGHLFSEHRDELPAYIECLGLAGRVDAVTADVRLLFDEVHVAVANEIIGQQAAGIIPPWAAPQPMAQLIVSLINGVILAAVADPQFDVSQALAIGQQFIALTIAAAGR